MNQQELLSLREALAAVQAASLAIQAAEKELAAQRRLLRYHEAVLGVVIRKAKA